MRSLSLHFLAMTLIIASVRGNASGPHFEPNWSSLRGYETPDCFRNATFGIFSHWGPMSAVPGHKGCYGCHIHMQEGAEWEGDYETHLRTFGHASKFGYKDLIPLWTAENWNTDALIALNPLPWQTDTSLASTWFHNGDGTTELTDKVVIHNLCDIISKNGNMLLNVALNAGGTLPENEKKILEGIGQWLQINGEAIYDTRPWVRFGEGPSQLELSDFKQNTQPLSAQDIRFTQKDDTLYAIFMAWPADGLLRIHSLTAADSIELIGSDVTLSWANGLDGITVQLPADPVGSIAYSLRIKGHQSLLAAPNLLAWCIVPYDSRERGPAERMAMLKQLGIGQYVWDWRQKHLAELPEEIKASREAGIHLRGVWLWIDDDYDRVGALAEANQTVLRAVEAAHLPLEFWVGFNANFFEGLDQDQRVAKGIEMIAYLRDQVARTGGTLALYNHGDWFGQPDNQLAILEEISDSTIGMVYNFHHEMAQRKFFAQYLPRMLPYLRAVNLTGMPEGKTGVFPLGSGKAETEVLQLLSEAGYTGPLGLLGHVEEADVEEILRANLKGFRSLAENL